MEERSTETAGIPLEYAIACSTVSAVSRLQQLQTLGRMMIAGRRRCRCRYIGVGPSYMRLRLGNVQVGVQCYQGTQRRQGPLPEAAAETRHP